jgi:hypothetical protein
MQFITHCKTVNQPSNALLGLLFPRQIALVDDFEPLERKELIDIMVSSEIQGDQKLEYKRCFSQLLAL